MNAIVRHAYGGPDVLRLEDVEKPVVHDDSVLVRVRAASINALDWHMMRGAPLLARMGQGLRTPKAAGLGVDVAGEVEAVGTDVTELRPGDAVFGRAAGALAEYVRGGVRSFVPKPANISFEQAAAVAVAGCTALQGLRDKGQLRPGQRVLINGGGGGVGTFTVQIAKAMGATVTGVASTSKLGLVRSIGADDVIDYTREDFTDGSRTWDVIVDTAGRRPLRELRRALTPKGALVVVGGDGGGNWTGGFFRGMLRGPIVSMFVGQKLGAFTAKTTKEDLQALSELIEAGKVTPVVDRTYDLVEAADAVRYLAEGHSAGKIVVTV